ncbi:hypothetical protein ABT071_21895 [Streptomyces sp. NPDC002506]|uniref:hypothetical protein n=1 Tax=Streptomyces sp. NPDC002506 TaxID=3154536 RepID=UPI00332E051A
MSDNPVPRNDRPARRRTPAHFRMADAALVQDLLAGADEVASRSFLGSGGRTRGPDAASRTGAGSELPPAEREPDPPRPDAAAAGQDARGAQRPAQAAPGPAPGTAPALVRTPAPDADESPAPGSGTVAWSHAAVHESFADAKLASARWKAHGFRIAPDVLTRLKNRVNADRRHAGNAHLAIGHYVDAALRHMPHEVSQLVAMAEDFGARQLWYAEKTQSSTYRVGEKAYALVSGLTVVLQEADYGRRGTHVVSAGVQVFLDVLDEQGPLSRPAAPVNRPDGRRP